MAEVVKLPAPMDGETPDRFRWRLAIWRAHQGWKQPEAAHAALASAKYPQKDVVA